MNEPPRVDSGKPSVPTDVSNGRHASDCRIAVDVSDPPSADVKIDVRERSVAENLLT